MLWKSKPLVVALLVSPFLWSCASVETRPAVDASLYLIDLETTVDPKLTEFDPNVAKGAGSGMLRGAGMGMGGCIYAGASIDAASAGSSFLLGTALGILVSPACALVGGVAGGGLAESKDDVATRLTTLNTASIELGYPDSLGLLVDDVVNANRVYRIHQEHYEDAQTLQYDPGTSDGYEDLTIEISSFKVGEDSAPALLPRPVDALDTPNATLRIHITDYGFEGGGVDPKLALRLAADVCVIEHQTGSALLFQKISLMTQRRKLEDWAELGKEGLQEETEALTTRLASRTIQSLGRQVRLEHKASCARSRMQELFLGSL